MCSFCLVLSSTLLLAECCLISLYTLQAVYGRNNNKSHFCCLSNPLFVSCFIDATVNNKQYTAVNILFNVKYYPNVSFWAELLPGFVRFSPRSIRVGMHVETFPSERTCSSSLVKILAGFFTAKHIKHFPAGEIISLRNVWWCMKHDRREH